MKIFKLSLITFLLMGLTTAWGTTQTGELNFTELKKSAKQGDVEAQFQLGLKRLKEQGTSNEYKKETLRLIREAAEQGHSLAKRAFVAIFATEFRIILGKSPNHKEAFESLKKHVNEHNEHNIRQVITAQYTLGFMYYLGIGTPQDKYKAFYWFEKSTDQGHAYTQYNLGVMYDNGEGTPQNSEQALAWYQKAAEQGHAEAQKMLLDRP